MFRFFRQLTQLALMITVRRAIERVRWMREDSIRSLIWALVLLAIIIYAFAGPFRPSKPPCKAIFLTVNVSSWLHVELGSPGPATWRDGHRMES